MSYHAFIDLDEPQIDFEEHDNHTHLPPVLPDDMIPFFQRPHAFNGTELDNKLIRSSLYKGYLQVENSIPMRMAIIEAMLLNNDQNIGKINGEQF